MNLLENWVVSVLGEPVMDSFTDNTGIEHVYWRVKVNADCHGSTSETTLTFSTREEALKVREGYMFMA